MISIHTITIKARDVALVARFWRDFLRYEVSPNHSDSVLLCGDGPSLLIQPTGSLPVAGRIHIDLRPDDAGDEVLRALDLGAQAVDVGQTGEEGWTVMCDPEGNVFCVLQSVHEAEAQLAVDPGSRTPIG